MGCSRSASLSWSVAGRASDRRLAPSGPSTASRPGPAPRAPATLPPEFTRECPGLGANLVSALSPPRDAQEEEVEPSWGDRFLMEIDQHKAIVQARQAGLSFTAATARTRMLGTARTPMEPATEGL